MFKGLITTHFLPQKKKKYKKKKYIKYKKFMYLGQKMGYFKPTFSYINKIKITQPAIIGCKA